MRAFAFALEATVFACARGMRCARDITCSYHLALSLSLPLSRSVCCEPSVVAVAHTRLSTLHTAFGTKDWGDPFPTCRRIPKEASR